MCRRMRGICIKTVDHDKRWYMNETAPLHWRIVRDSRGHVFLQLRHAVDSPDSQWSEPAYHWDSKAARPEGRQRADDRESGLIPSDLHIAPRRLLGEKRQGELNKALRGAKRRLTEEDWTALAQVFEDLSDAPLESLDAPPERWKFDFEGDIADQESLALEMHLPPQAVYHTRTNRKVLG